MGVEVILTRHHWRIAVLALSAATVVALATTRVHAHKPITSPYTFEKDVLPIVRSRCTPCHVSGGVAPMSLMTAADATPWAESIRVELIAGHMPPWPIGTPPGRFRNEDRLTGRELNVLLTWATGGTPPGDPTPADAPPPPARDWALGSPDLVVTLDPVTVPANQQELVKSFLIPTGTSERRMVRAIDLLPGTPAVVRSARIAVEAGTDAQPSTARISAGIERTLALWVPGEPPVPLEPGIGFDLPAGASLAVQIRYRKTWQYEGKAMQDQSRIGIYFARANAEPVRAITFRADDDAPVAEISESTGASNNGRRKDGPVRLLAIEPDPDMDHVLASVAIEQRDHSTSSLFALRARPAWARRYWFTRPVTMPPGGSWTARFEPYTEPAILVPPSAGAPANTPARRAITLDVVEGR